MVYLQQSNALNRILDNINAPENKSLAPAEKELILMGLDDYKNGEVIDDEELRKEEDSWLSE